MKVGECCLLWGLGQVSGLILGLQVCFLGAGFCV